MGDTVPPAAIAMCTSYTVPVMGSGAVSFEVLGPIRAARDGVAL